MTFCSLKITLFSSEVPWKIKLIGIELNVFRGINFQITSTHSYLIIRLFFLYTSPSRFFNGSFLDIRSIHRPPKSCC